MSTVNLTVLKEHDDFIVIDKPGGVGMHNTTSEEDDSSHTSVSASHSTLTKGLVSLVREQLDDQNLFPVHRLDKETSGLLLLAKGKTATRQLSQLFGERQVQKYYWAISSLKPNKKQGSVIGDMVKARNGNWKLTREKARPSITQFFSFGLEQGKRVFLVKPYTGKTHQIRVVLKSIGAPILGDSRYGGDISDRMYLHASHLQFTHKHHNYAFSCLPTSGNLFVTPAFIARYEELASPTNMAWPKLPKNLVPSEA